MAMRVIDDSDLQGIAVAIQSKDNGGQMTVKEMRGRIEAIPTVPAPVQNPALILWDWEDTKLAEYSREDALALTELPSPNSLAPYAGVDHDWLLFQEWNWNLENVKTWVQENKHGNIDVGTSYTTTDGKGHNYWNSPREDAWRAISKRKHASNIGKGSFANCLVLAHVNIPQNISIGAQAFENCTFLKSIVLPKGLTVISEAMFKNCHALTHILFPNSLNIINASAFNGCESLAQVNLPQNLTEISRYAFYGCPCISKISIPEKVLNIGFAAFSYCITLNDILLQSKPSLENIDAFANIASNYYIYVPRANLSWFEAETNWSTIYAQGHIVAIEDYIDYLESIGFNVDKYKEVA